MRMVQADSGLRGRREDTDSGLWVQQAAACGVVGKAYRERSVGAG